MRGTEQMEWSGQTSLRRYHLNPTRKIRKSSLLEKMCKLGTEMHKNIPGKVISKCKGPEAGQFSTYEELKEGSLLPSVGGEQKEKRWESSARPLGHA